MLKGFLISTDALIALTIAIVIVTIPVINSSQQNTHTYKLLAWDYLMLKYSYFYSMTEGLFYNLTLVNVTEATTPSYRLSPIFLAHNALCGCTTLPCTKILAGNNNCFTITEVNTSSITNKSAFVVLNDRWK
ncbi:Uncharacterised protein [uncultured archaeon]|nr:Uncharacterised protein [uncultured archaeon]